MAVSTITTEKYVLLEHPSISTLPGGVLVKESFIILPERAPYLAPVVLTDKSEHDVTIPQKCVIDEIHAFQRMRVLSHEYSMRSPKSDSQMPNLIFNFEFSPVSTEWKEHKEHITKTQ